MGKAYVIFTPPGWLIATDLEDVPDRPDVWKMSNTIQLESVVADLSMIEAAAQATAKNFGSRVSKAYPITMDGEIRKEAVLHRYEAACGSFAEIHRSLRKSELKP